MDDVVNHVTGDCFWYHTTPKERLESILRDGLLPKSLPAWQGVPEPWIYLSTLPWLCGENPKEALKDHAVLEINLAGYGTKNVGWPFVDGPGTDSWERRWQLRAFLPIDPGRLRVMAPKETAVAGNRANGKATPA